jgi:hypothetical protein
MNELEPISYTTEKGENYTLACRNCTEKGGFFFEVLINKKRMAE